MLCVYHILRELPTYMLQLPLIFPSFIVTSKYQDILKGYFNMQNLQKKTKKKKAMVSFHLYY